MKCTLHILALLIGLTFVGCGTLQNVPPAPNEASLVPHTQGAHFVARGENEIWWMTWNPDWELIKANPQAREVLARIRPPLGYAPHGLAAGFGAAWISDGGSHPSVHKIDPQTNRPVAKIQLASWWSKGNKGKYAYIAIGDSAVWATVNILDKVFRIDPKTNTVVATIPIGHMRLSDNVGRLAIGEGAVWVLRDRILSRIDPEINRITADIPIPGLLLAGTGRIAIGGGAIWVAAGGTVTRIDPQTNKIVTTFQVSGDVKPVKNCAITYMVVAKETIWALAISFSGSFMRQSYGQFALAEIDMKTNSIRTIRQLGAGDASYLFTPSGPSLAITDNAAWVCLPTGLYVIPIDPSH